MGFTAIEVERFAGGVGTIEASEAPASMVLDRGVFVSANRRQGKGR